MRADLLPDTIWVRLSARNLAALRAMLDNPFSFRTILSGFVFNADGELIPGLCLAVQVEPDRLHYRDRPEPGPMSPATEAALRLLEHVDADGDGDGR